MFAKKRNELNDRTLTIKAEERKQKPTMMVRSKKGEKKKAGVKREGKIQNLRILNKG